MLSGILNERFTTQAKKMTNVNKVKPLLRRKSDLPQDSYTMRALSDHKRADEYLVTPPDPNNC
jgi:serine/threonine-protein phosphatase 2A regulatory subunit B'